MSVEHGKFKPDEPKDTSRRRFFKQLGALGLLAALETSGLSKIAKATEKYTEQQELKELLPEVERYSKDLKTVLENIYNPENRQELPATVWEKVDKIFSGPLKPLRNWNRELADEGMNSHIAAYLMQDFRNSTIADKLSMIYKSLPPEKRIELENTIREKINDHTAYELMFKIDLRPPVFSFKDDPENNIEKSTPSWNNNEPYYNAKSKHGQKIFEGVDSSPSKHTEGNYSYAYDEGGCTKIATVNYYGNVQPNFRFYRDDKNFDFFKNYLGAKGMFLWYKTTTNGGKSPSKQTPLNQEQTNALKNFYRWDRGE